MLQEQTLLFPVEKNAFSRLYYLPFNGFVIDNRPDWFASTKEVLQVIREGKNPCLTGFSGSGKTVVALLVYEVLQKRTLLVAPTTNLVNEHCKLYERITGTPRPRQIIGDTPEKNRIWNDPDDNLIICTAEVFLSELDNDRIALEKFDLFMMDEAHHAVKDHTYVQTASIFHSTGKPFFSFTATLGEVEKNKIIMETIKRNCFIDKVIDLVVPMPERKERKVDVEIDETLKQLHKIFDEILGGIIMEMEYELQIRPLKVWMTQKEITELQKKINAEHDDRFITNSTYNKTFRVGNFLLAKYRKTLHAYRLVINESYESFLDYAQTVGRKNRKGKENKNGISLYFDPRFQKAMDIARNHVFLHPKEKTLIDELSKIKGRALIFFQNKATARNLKEKLKRLNYRTGYIFGGKEKKTEKAKEILMEMKICEIDHLLVTSVAEEGITLPGFDVVINYNPPNSKTARIQRTGRIGRMKKGESIFLVMNNSFEKGLYWKTMIRKNTPSGSGLSKKKKNRRGDDPRQLTLF